jgi:energy-coupling factor transporter ATP-binding protein EcfA2
MLEYLELENYRCFSEHHLALRPFTVLVGRNNAGKSTLVETLRLVSIVTSRYQYLNYGPAPKWSGYSSAIRGVFPSNRNLGIDFATVFHRYGEPPAAIRARFREGAMVEILVGPEGRLFAMIQGKDGRRLMSKSAAERVELPTVAILPQVTALQKVEQKLTPGYVESSMGSYLSSLHFRNQLGMFKQQLPLFRQLAEKTWPGLHILDLNGEKVLPGEGNLSLLVRDGDFVAEVGWMGHGLQMWLQMIWFLALNGDYDTLILGEPDVYLHADLQRRLVKLLRNYEAQVLIATHSLEIIAEVEPDEIIIVDRSQPESGFANSLPVVQDIVEHIGGVQNLQLTRLWSAQRCLLVEGKDLSILRRLYACLFPETDEPLAAMPHLSIGGWGGWPYAVGSKLLLKNAVGHEIRVYCLLDRDYHSEGEINARYDEALSRGIDLHIWRRKELENYLLVAQAIVRLIGAGQREQSPELDDVQSALWEITEKLRDETFDAVACHHLAVDRAGGLTKANRRARELMEEKWHTLELRLEIVSGKSVLSRLSDWSKRNYGVSFSAEAIARKLLPFEIAEEVQSVLAAIEAGEPISERSF